MQPGFGWAIDRKTYEKLFKKQAPPDIVTDSFSLWDPTNRGQVDVLQMIASCILTARGTIPDKIGSLFQVSLIL